MERGAQNTSLVTTRGKEVSWKNFGHRGSMFLFPSAKVMERKTVTVPLKLSSSRGTNGLPMTRKLLRREERERHGHGTAFVSLSLITTQSTHKNTHMNPPNTTPPKHHASNDEPSLVNHRAEAAVAAVAAIQSLLVLYHLLCVLTLSTTFIPPPFCPSSIFRASPEDCGRPKDNHLPVFVMCCAVCYALCARVFVR